MTAPSFLFEDRYQDLAVAGIDEVGRGPLAGPVVAAAVVIDRTKAPADILALINDSKKLSEKKRAYLAEHIPTFAEISVGFASVTEIDQINILQASLLAMQRAYLGLKTPPAVALVDGNKAPKLACRVQTIIQGDSKSLSIAAASIMAKQHRDLLMRELDLEFPHYGWSSNAGYGTATHLKAIQLHGVTPHHRRSFAPVTDALLKVSSANN